MSLKRHSKMPDRIEKSPLLPRSVGPAGQPESRSLISRGSMLLLLVSCVFPCCVPFAVGGARLWEVVEVQDESSDWLMAAIVVMFRRHDNSQLSRLLTLCAQSRSLPSLSLPFFLSLFFLTLTASKVASHQTPPPDLDSECRRAIGLNRR